MTEPNQSSWALLTTYGNGFQADVARESLQALGIPVLLRGLQSGIFGAGFGGTVVGGVDVLVPKPELERARDVLGLAE